MTRNTRISLAKKYTMAPGHQLHHVYIRAHLTQPQHQYLRVLMEYFSLLPLKSHIQWRKRSGYPLPLSRAASLLAPPPTPHSTDMSSPGGQAGLLPTGTPSTTELNSWIEALDLATREPRPSTSASVSTIWLSSTSPSPCRGNVSDKRTVGHPDHMTDVRKNREKMWIYTLRSIAPHGIYGSNQTDSHTPHSKRDVSR